MLTKKELYKYRRDTKTAIESSEYPRSYTYYPNKTPHISNAAHDGFWNRIYDEFYDDDGSLTDPSDDCIFYEPDIELIAKSPAVYRTKYGHYLFLAEPEIDRWVEMTEFGDVIESNLILKTEAEVSAWLDKTIEFRYDKLISY